MNCPICSKVVSPATENRHFPFCSSRCRTIDLGNWLSGKLYVIPSDETASSQIEESKDEKDEKDEE